MILFYKNLLAKIMEIWIVVFVLFCFFRFNHDFVCPYPSITILINFIKLFCLYFKCINGIDLEFMFILMFGLHRVYLYIFLQAIHYWNSRYFYEILLMIRACIRERESERENESKRQSQSNQSSIYAMWLIFN